LDARRALRSLHPDLRPETIQVVTLLASELVSNAVRHAAADPIALHVRVMPDCVHVDVTDEGPGFTSGPNPEHPGRNGGWGLFMVDELAAAWGVNDDGGTHVWFEVER